MKPEYCIKIYDHLLENTNTDNSISSIAKSLNISESDVEACMNTLPSFFIKKEAISLYTLSQEEAANREALLLKLNPKKPNKNGGIFWFLILFTIGISLFTVVISKGN